MKQNQALVGKPVTALINSASKRLIADYNLSPHMLLIQVGNDPASSYYVQSIIASGAKLGCRVSLEQIPDSIGQDAFIDRIVAANRDNSIHGIMIQKPLPRHLSDAAVNLAIHPDKDVDCIHPINMGKIIMESDGFLPCTPAAVFYLMRYYDINPLGKKVVILGRSNVVGKPLMNILLWKKAFTNATVTVCHSKTANLASITAEADILISAIGLANFVKANMIKDNSVLIDVGINEITDQDGKQQYVGDIDYISCQDKALAITPVPGGVGRVTTSVLFLNLIHANLISMGVNKTIDEYITLIFNANHEDN